VATGEQVTLVVHLRCFVCDTVAATKLTGETHRAFLSTCAEEDLAPGGVKVRPAFLELPGFRVVYGVPVMRAEAEAERVRRGARR
jgi:hypothetical protein